MRVSHPVNRQECPRQRDQMVQRLWQVWLACSKPGGWSRVSEGERIRTGDDGVIMWPTKHISTFFRSNVESHHILLNRGMCSDFSFERITGVIGLRRHHREAGAASRAPIKWLL